eukprot:9157846-Pyramimonas_sp.AAC.1
MANFWRVSIVSDSGIQKRSCCRSSNQATARAMVLLRAAALGGKCSDHELPCFPRGSTNALSRSSCVAATLTFAGLSGFMAGFMSRGGARPLQRPSAVRR